LRSQYGASYKLFMLLNSGKFEINLSVPLTLEYEGAGKRLVGKKGALKANDIDDIVDYFAHCPSEKGLLLVAADFE